ncbi:MAG: helix-turn-helix transcriptional regulator, partial [Actinobacteria bacterium]|nr:helix-turn-helix transcriptional regulator [Actinomycetota bacterium]
MPVATKPVIDGRRARRERGRLAVTDAMIDLVFEGNIPPTSEQIAERAGVSVASIFRYFDTLDDLRRATTDVYFERFAHVFEIPEIGKGVLATRIDTFVSSRVTMHEATEPMARLVRSRALDNSDIGTTLQGVR